MGSPLGPSSAKAFLAHYEQIWLDDCPNEFKPVYYKRYVDDIFVLFQSPHHLEKFNEYLNTKHADIIKNSLVKKTLMDHYHFRCTNITKEESFYYNSLS